MVEVVVVVVVGGGVGFEDDAIKDVFLSSCKGIMNKRRIGSAT